MQSDIIKDLSIFINESKTPYHCVNSLTRMLDSAGFKKLLLHEQFETKPGKYYSYLGGTLFAWINPNKKCKEFKIIGAHSDSPNLRLRPNAVYENSFSKQLGIEVYGSPLLNSWLDRDLCIGGQVYTSKNSKQEVHLVDSEHPIAKIPQLAIHLDRNVNSQGLTLDSQNHLDPLLFIDDKSNNLINSVFKLPADIVTGFDLMLYDSQPGEVIGKYKSDSGGYFSSARIDNLISVFIGAKSMANLQETNFIPVLTVFDHEEVGSESNEGADSNLINQVLERISYTNKQTRDEYLITLANSFALSLDAAHATHPNYQHKHDNNHPIIINHGLVIKQNANKRYATTAKSKSELLIKLEKTELEFQDYSHPNNIPCGSTIGPLISKNLAINTIDVGIPMLAMHSIRETAGTSDIFDLDLLVKNFWS